MKFNIKKDDIEAIMTKEEENKFEDVLKEELKFNVQQNITDSCEVKELYKKGCC